jgi:hypothetical protein
MYMLYVYEMQQVEEAGVSKAAWRGCCSMFPGLQWRPNTPGVAEPDDRLTLFLFSGVEASSICSRGSE